MSAAETAIFTPSNLLIEAQRPAIAIDFAPPITDTPEARQERVGAVLVAVAFAIDAGLRTQNPDNLKMSSGYEAAATILHEQGDTYLFEQRIWEIGRYETRNPGALHQLGADLGRGLIGMSDNLPASSRELGAGWNTFGDAVIAKDYENSSSIFGSHWQKRQLGVAQLAENTLAVGFYNDYRQHLDEGMLVRELANPDLSEAVGQNIADLGIRLSPNQPVRVDSLAYGVDKAEDASIVVPSAIGLQAIADYIIGQKSSDLTLSRHFVSEPYTHAAACYTYLGREDSELAVRFEIEAFAADKSQRIKFIGGSGPSELVVVNRNRSGVKTPATLSGLHLKTYAVSQSEPGSDHARRLIPAEDILFSPKLREEAEELNTALRGIRELLIEQ